jgi:RNA polymerase sigma-70 factor (ECF subfamily)
MTGPGEAGGFDALFTSFYRRLARLLYRVTGDAARAEDVASEAFWRLHSKPPADRTNLEGWLYRTGLRLALDQIKKERRRARYEALAAVFGMAASPHQALEQNEERERVRRVLGALKVEQVALILLRAEGLTYAEMAAALRLKQSSVGTLLARAEKAFRKEYVNRYGQPRR